MKGLAEQIGAVALPGVIVAATLQASPVLRIVVAHKQPVEVLDARLESHPSLPESLLVEIVNTSGKRAWLVEFTLAPADCPHSDHPIASSLTYPAKSPRTNESSLANTLEPGAHATLVLPGSRYRQVIAYQRKAGCPATALPELALSAVTFCDGSGWEGFASGPGHSLWSGRPWQPPSKPECRASS
jgi:hypothetical protein